MAVQPALPLPDPDTVVLSRTTLLRVLEELERGLTSAGHRALVNQIAHRGHCPTGRGCAPGCHAYRALLHDLMDALGVPR